MAQLVEQGDQQYLETFERPIIFAIHCEGGQMVKLNLRIVTMLIIKVLQRRQRLGTYVGDVYPFNAASWLDLSVNVKVIEDDHVPFHVLDSGTYWTQGS